MIDIASLSLGQLTSLIKAAETQLKVLAKLKPPAVIRRQPLKGLASHGGSISAPSTARIPKKRVAKRNATKVAPKYRDPDSARNTWSGRGSTPLWLVEKIKRGQSAADFLIPGLARPTAKKGGAVGRRSLFKQP